MKNIFRKLLTAGVIANAATDAAASDYLVSIGTPLAGASAALKRWYNLSWFQNRVITTRSVSEDPEPHDSHPR